MSSHWVFNGCDEAVKSQIKAYWVKKWPRLEKLLTHYRPEEREIRLTVYRHQQSPQRCWYEIRAVIHLSTGTLAAETNDKNPRVAVDRVADTLMMEIKRHNERVRHDSIYKRKNRRRADLSAAGPLLERDSELGRRGDFFRLLRPVLSFLADHASRELRILEIEGRLHRSEVTLTDVLDEVLLRAWQRLGDRPRKLPLKLWLTDLLHEVLDEAVKQDALPHESLEEEVNERLASEAPQVDEQDWWTTFYGGYDETLRLSDLIGEKDANLDWERLDAKEQTSRILGLMKGMPKLQRQAFLLHAAEDYDPFEIAMVQDRDETEVRADIERARETLKERLRAAASDKEIESSRQSPVTANSPQAGVLSRQERSWLTA
jgi:DNA-directed RNA polymerase specialized sigma24 family protein/ribosome-associated translation inhibitor RaiA